MNFPPPPNPYTGPNYEGLTFNLASQNGKSSHLLMISTQVSETILRQAYITGTWDGEMASGQPAGNPKIFIGHLSGNGIGIECTWATPKGGTNTLVGGLTYTPGHTVKVNGIPKFVPAEAFLQGTVTAYDADGNVLPNNGPGDVSGSATGWRPHKA